MEMHQVRYFLAVASQFNFTRAAEDLNVAQPSLTRAIQKLEAELGGPLFRRERSNTHLTELGRMILPHLQAAFGAAEAAKSQARRLKTQDIGSLTLGICAAIDSGPTAALLVQAVRRLGSVELSIEVASADIVERRLIAGEFDAAILAPGETVNERFDLCSIDEEDFVVAFASDHRFADERSVTLEALEGEKLIVSLGCDFDKALAELMAGRGLSQTIRCRSNDPRWIAELVRSGLGCAVVPSTMARTHGLSHRALDGVPLRHRTVLVTVAGRRHSLALATLIRQIETGA